MTATKAREKLYRLLDELAESRVPVRISGKRNNASSRRTIGGPFKRRYICFPSRACFFVADGGGFVVTLST